ncbi:hypothetical protein [Pedobacter punctiformis]|nr:hypothetical protein [Pedobacter sp. HCMS5-2]
MKSIKKISFDECCFTEAASQFFDFDKVIKENDHNVNRFASTCPLALEDKYKDDPFLFVEYFFSIDGLAGHKKYLRKWFKKALSKDRCVTNAKDFLFFCNQFTQLMNAGYLIADRQIKYLPQRRFNNNTETFGEWLIKFQNKSILENEYYVAQYDASSLDIISRNDPYAILKKELTFRKIQKLRYGMLEWLYAAFSKQYSIEDLNKNSVFDQYESMENILEAFYLIIVETKPLQILN